VGIAWEAGLLAGLAGGGLWRSEQPIRIHGTPEPASLVYEQTPIPQLQTGEVLLRVYAAAITPTEFSWLESVRFLTIA